MSAPSHPDGFEPVLPLAELDTLPVGVALGDGTRVCLVRDGDDVHAVLDRCTHRDFHLSGGDVVRPCVLECPWHGARFDVRTGAALSGPATDPLVVFPVRMVDGMIHVGPPAHSPLPADG